MIDFAKFRNTVLGRLEKDPLAPAWFALLAELVLLGFLGFAGLVFLEALLPTFVSVRINLAVYFVVLLLLSALLLAFGRTLGLSFRFTISSRHPLTWAAGLWVFVILGLSLLKFPWWLLLLLLLGFLLVFRLFLELFLAPESAEKEK